MDIVEVPVTDTVLEKVTEVIVVSEGTQGPAGPVQITVSTTAPVNPSVNQLWLDIS